MVFSVALVVISFITTFAWGMTAPAESCTTPVMAPVLVCAATGPQERAIAIAKRGNMGVAYHRLAGLICYLLLLYKVPGRYFYCSLGQGVGSPFTVAARLSDPYSGTST